MTPLDAAKALANYEEQRSSPCPDCWHPDQRINNQAHAKACSHLMLPRIVAALEAAQALIACGYPQSPNEKLYGGFECAYCFGGIMGERDTTPHHDADCPLPPLAAALLPPATP